MSFAEIKDAIPALSYEERAELIDILCNEESPEMIAAAQVGLRSLEQEGIVTLEEARQQFPQWFSK